MTKSIPFLTHIRSAPNTRAHLERDWDRSYKFLGGLSPYGPTADRPSEGINYVDSIDASYSSVTYTISVGVGSPPTKYNLLLDVVSSNTWTGATIPYKPTSTSHDTGNNVTLNYRDAIVIGKEVADRVTLNEELVIQNQLIIAEEDSHGFDASHGTLGIGPINFARNTASYTTKVPTIIENLYSQGLIPSVSWSIFYDPPLNVNVANTGELILGGTDATKYTGGLNYVPITSTPPASSYWGIKQSVTYGDNTTILNTTAGIVDISTTFLLIATEAYYAYRNATGATLDSATGLLTITAEQYEKLQSLYFNIGGVTYELTRNAQIWPRALNNSIRGQEGHIYLIIAELGTKIESGLDFIIGYTWLQRFYTHFDTTNARIGFATTTFTDAETN